LGDGGGLVQEMSERPHKKLVVWQQAMELVKDVHRITNEFPRDEQFILTSQMRRSAISVPSNIAEGSARSSDREKTNFLNIARGSLSELDTQMELCRSLGYLKSADKTDVQERIDRVSALLRGLIQSHEVL
jgi:four helix bundle protein